ncbi:hypothetical protein [Actinoplanes sp. NPDC051411]|uniref:hypothetical protein n=1 Tax=Actinoplanes sp. NPDC051411 TaxID=3155522 RepID=UPI00342365F4
MIFGVSTLGCPGLPLPEVGALLRRHRVSAVQLRCAADEPVHVGLSPSARRRAREQLESAGLTLLGLATYVQLSSGADGRRRTGVPPWCRDAAACRAPRF